MLRLMEHAKLPTIAICMGDLGMATRILSLRYGAPLTYTAMDSERKIAPGMIHGRPCVNCIVPKP